MNRALLQIPFIRIRPLLRIFLLSFVLSLSSLACDQIRAFHADVLYRKANQAHDDEKFDEAIATYKRILEIDVDHALANYELGVAYVDIEQPHLAKKYIRKLYQLNRRDLAVPLEKLIRKSKLRTVKEYDWYQTK